MAQPYTKSSVRSGRQSELPLLLMLLLPRAAGSLGPVAVKEAWEAPAYEGHPLHTREAPAGPSTGPAWRVGSSQAPFPLQHRCLSLAAPTSWGAFPCATETKGEVQCG